jgi:23S rRNA pseudouridine2605 synthase
MTSPKTKKTAKTKTTKKTAALMSESTEPILETASEAEIPKTEIEDPIGDVTDGEAEAAIEAEPEPKSETEIEAEDSPEPEDEDSDASEPEFTPQPGAPADGSSSVGWKPRPPAKLERLQKILAAAGVASRRSAESLIEQGRVQVNGKIVTVLGTKADAARDHIRVDGKLLQGAERLRYFVLNKPRGFVTTVKDPEGRPTVMQFFDKMKERLYPVGRLDYLSEGLLVVTNDGELANKLTKAASGVEKTYLVKVAGQPTEAELDILRGGVSIALGAPGSRSVRTSPARIRQVRQGDNPWYEVVLIEGRNRELRKMFEEIGHFVEKIRRTGYGPLVLDQEPGNLRELQPEEVDALRQAAEGSLRTPKSKDLRRRNLLDAGLLPTVLPKPSSRPRTATPLAPPPAAKFNPVRSDSARPAAFNPKKFGPTRPVRPTRPADSFASGDANKLFRSSRPSAESYRPAARPAWKKNDRPTRPPSRFAADSAAPGRPAYDRPRTGSAREDSAGTGRTGAGRPFSAKPTWKKPERPDRSDRPARPERPARPDFKRSAPPRRETPARSARVFDEDLGPVRPPNLHIEEITGPDRSSQDRSSSSRPSPSRSSAPRARSSRPSAPRSSSDRPRPSRSSFDRPASSQRPSAASPNRSSFDRPARAEGTRPYTTSSGKPRAGGARPSSKPGGWKPGKSASRPYKPAPGARSGSGSRPSGSSRPYTPRAEGASEYRPTSAKPYPNSASRAERKAGPGWKPKTRYGGGKPASSARSKPRPGSSAKPSHRVKRRPPGRL